jgi:hypothetical protein
LPTKAKDTQIFDLRLVIGARFEVAFSPCPRAELSGFFRAAGPSEGQEGNDDNRSGENMTFWHIVMVTEREL